MPSVPLRHRPPVVLVALIGAMTFQATPPVAARCRMPAYDLDVVTALERPLGPHASLLVQLVPTWSRRMQASDVQLFTRYGWQLPEVALVGGSGRYLLMESVLSNNLHTFASTRVVPPGDYQLVGIGDPRPIRVGDTPRYVATEGPPELVDVEVTVLETFFTCRGGYLGFRIAARFRQDPVAHQVAFVRLLSPGLAPALIDLRGSERDADGRIVDTYREQRCTFTRFREGFGGSGQYHYALIYEDGTVQPVDAPAEVRVTVPPELGERCRRR